MKILTLKHNIVPRWVIILIDQFLILVSFSLTFFSIRTPDSFIFLHGHFLNYLFLYSIICLIIFAKLHVHDGLIRYSNLQDMLKIFIAQFATSLIFLILVESYWEVFFNIYSYNVNGLLVINFFVSSGLLVMLRMVAKEVFSFAKKTLSAQKTVLICGTDNHAILLKHALETNPHSELSVSGFIDIENNSSIRFIEQKPIFQTPELRDLLIRHKVDKLLVTVEQLENKAVKELIELCLQHDINILTVPAADQWISGNLSNKQIRDLKIEDLLQRAPIVIANDKIYQELAGKNVLVTGAAGSIGSEIVRQVMNYKPAMVILLDQAESPLYALQLEISEKFPAVRIAVKLGDVRNNKTMSLLFDECHPNIIFHAAAYKHVPMMEDNPSEAITTNVLGTKNVADLSLKHNAEAFVMISSDKAVNPSNVMGASKRIAEIYVQSLAQKENYASTKFITTRFGNVLGSNGSVIPRFQEQLKKGGPVTVTHPEITRYFMTIPEAVNLVLEAGVMGKGGEIFVFDMGESVKIKDLAVKMIELAGLTPDKDIRIVYSGLRPGEKLYEELIGENESLQPTYHKRIRIAQGSFHPYISTSDSIQELINLIGKESRYDSHIVQQMKFIVRDYISMNSRFEELDEFRVPEAEITKD